MPGSVTAEQGSVIRNEYDGWRRRAKMLSPLAAALLLAGCFSTHPELKPLPVNRNACHNTYYLEGGMQLGDVARLVLGLSTDDRTHDDVVQAEVDIIAQATHDARKDVSVDDVKHADANTLLLLPFNHHVGTPTPSCPK